MLERVHHDLNINLLCERICFLHSIGCNVVSLLIVDIEDDVNIALDAPSKVTLAKLDANSIVDDVVGWLLLDQIEMWIETQVDIDR